MRTVCKLAREVLDIAIASAKVGVTTDEIDKIVHEATIERNAYPSPLNYRGFPKSCCTSVNEVICHGIPDSRPLQDGDILNIDITVYYNGFHGDVNETICIGNVDEKGRELVNVTREALEKAISIVKPGTFYRDVGNVISKHVNQHGFSVVRSYCGHGIGQLFHTNPNVPHYGKNKAVGIMKPGHTFTIEPMINEGSWQDILWPDDWTAVTKDGKRSAQFEHTLLVTENGCEVLTAKKIKLSKIILSL
jgi:methionyl aminopeptidase